MSDQHSSEHAREGQVQRAKRLREQIESLKTGQGSEAGHPKSLREQIEERAEEVRQNEPRPGG